MVILLRPGAPADEVRRLEEQIREEGLETHRSTGPERDLIIVVGETGHLSLSRLVRGSGAVERVIRVLGEAEHQKMLTRRSFINYCLWIGGALTACLAAIPGLSFVIPPQSRLRRPDAALVGDVEEFDTRPFKYVNLQDSRIIVLRTERGELCALSAICTHLDTCTVTWEARLQQLRCPCHRGAFDAYGNIIEGPPPRPLRSYPVQVVGKRVYIRSS